MIDSSFPNSYSRLKSDICELEALGAIIHSMQIPQNRIITQAMERLLQLAGTKHFLPEFSCFQIIILQAKWAREGKFDLGYSIPWKDVYSSWGSESQFKDIAQRKDTNKIGGITDSIHGSIKPSGFDALDIPITFNTDTNESYHTPRNTGVFSTGNINNSFHTNSAGNDNQVVENISWLFGSPKEDLAYTNPSTSATVLSQLPSNIVPAMADTVHNIYGTEFFPAQIDFNEISRLGLAQQTNSTAQQPPSFFEVGCQMKPVNRPSPSNDPAVEEFLREIGLFPSQSRANVTLPSTEASLHNLNITTMPPIPIAQNSFENMAFGSIHTDLNCLFQPTDAFQLCSMPIQSPAFCDASLLPNLGNMNNDMEVSITPPLVHFDLPSTGLQCPSSLFSSVSPIMMDASTTELSSLPLLPGNYVPVENTIKPKSVTASSSDISKQSQTPKKPKEVRTKTLGRPRTKNIQVPRRSSVEILPNEGPTVLLSQSVPKVKPPRSRKRTLVASGKSICGDGKAIHSTAGGIKSTVSTELSDMNGVNVAPKPQQLMVDLKTTEQFIMDYMATIDSGTFPNNTSGAVPKAPLSIRESAHKLTLPRLMNASSQMVIEPQLIPTLLESKPDPSVTCNMHSDGNGVVNAMPSEKVLKLAKLTEYHPEPQLLHSIRTVKRPLKITDPLSGSTGEKSLSINTKSPMILTATELLGGVVSAHPAGVGAVNTVGRGRGTRGGRGSRGGRVNREGRANTTHALGSAPRSTLGRPKANSTQPSKKRIKPTLSSTQLFPTQSADSTLSAPPILLASESATDMMLGSVLSSETVESDSPSASPLSTCHANENSMECVPETQSNLVSGFSNRNVESMVARGSSFAAAAESH
ncbi:hypothetical protein QVD99_002671 [Batrachochytrium dendrobatidis]|nr:hypothetical protein QVD99_002671 [Batrachochytrium dendrobatidis]